MKKIVFVCLGNICRSPMAEFVMKSLTDQVEVASRATSSWEHGNPIHRGTQQMFNKHNIPFDRTNRSQQMTDQDFYDFDYIIAMDSNNLADLEQMAPQSCLDKITPFAEDSVPDPWYTGDFDETYDRVLSGCQAWLAKLEKEAATVDQ